MEKLIPILIILFVIPAFAYDIDNEQEECHNLTSKLCDFILEHEKQLDKENISFEEYCWTAAYRVRYNSRHTFQFDGEPGRRFIFYTLTTGPAVKVYVKNDADGIYTWVGGPSCKILSFYTCKKQGSYHFKVVGESDGPGLYRSFFSYIKNK